VNRVSGLLVQRGVLPAHLTQAVLRMAVIRSRILGGVGTDTAYTARFWHGPRVRIAAIVGAFMTDYAPSWPAARGAADPGPAGPVTQDPGKSRPSAFVR